MHLSWEQQERTKTMLAYVAGGWFAAVLVLAGLSGIWSPPTWLVVVVAGPLVAFFLIAALLSPIVLVLLVRNWWQRIR